jgi:hypothetical protein
MGRENEVMKVNRDRRFRAHRGKYRLESLTRERLGNNGSWIRTNDRASEAVGFGIEVIVTVI